MFDKNYQYRTINSHRSAISAFHPKIEGFPVGQHPLVCNLPAGIFNERPPQPRYQQIWDVNLVLTHLHNSKSDNLSLSGKDLTEKLAMFLALTSAGRSSELDSFDVRFMQMTESKVVFHLAKLTKLREENRDVVPFKFL